MQSPEPRSNFMKVRCQKCKNEQIVFGKASTSVACLVCGVHLARPSGGKTNFEARVLEKLE